MTTAPRFFRSFALFTLLAIGLSGTVASSFAQEPAVPLPGSREIYVPLDDLNAILESDAQRVFLSREEYAEMLAKAKVTAQSLAPIAAAVTAAKYEAQLEAGRAVIEATLRVEILQPGLQFVPLQLVGVGVRSALLDGKPAVMVRDPQHGVLLAVADQGVHELRLTLTAPLVTSAAQQRLQVELPHAAAARLLLQVPGNVEVRSGAAVLERSVNAEANTTQLEVTMPRGPLTLELSLNNKMLAKDLVALARSVYVDEVTQSYERLHATVSLVVLHGALETAEITLPEGFEVYTLESPLVARWAVEQGVLRVTLREPATETVVLRFAAARNMPPADDWRFPQLEIKNVESQAAVIGLLLEDRLQMKTLAATALVPIDATVLSSSIPTTVLEAGAGLPKIRPVAAYYAPHEQFSLAASFERPAGTLFVTSSVLLNITEESQTAQINLGITPQFERVFWVDVLVPTAWQIHSAKLASGQPLLFERISNKEGADHVRVQLPQGAPLNSATEIMLQAQSVPEAWLTEWTEKTFAFPQFRVVDANRVEGAIALAVSENLEVRPDSIAGLLPLTETERRQFGLAQGTAALAYRHEGSLGEATFVAVRKEPSLVAEVYNFFRFAPGAVLVHHELNFDIREAGAKELVFALPASSPEQITIRGLAGAVVKDTRSEIVEEQRLWHVQLQQQQRGIVKVAVDYERVLTPTDSHEFSLPLAKAENVAYQTGLIAVEGHAELDVQVTQHPRKVDEGELYAAEYQVGPRLVGAFGYLGDTQAKVDVVRHPGFGLPTALVRQSRLRTQLGIAGISQTEATFYLYTKEAFLEVELPADAELWTITLDGRPTKPQKHNNRLLLSMPAGSAEQVRAVTVVFQQPTNPLHVVSGVRLAAPRLLVRSTNDATSEAVEVPSADAAWELVLPTGYEARRNFGSVEAALPTRQPALIRFWNGLYRWGQKPLPSPRFELSKGATHAAAKSPATEREELSDYMVPTPSASFMVPPSATDAPADPFAAEPTADMPVAESKKPAEMPLPITAPGQQPGLSAAPMTGLPASRPDNAPQAQMGNIAPDGPPAKTPDDMKAVRAPPLVSSALQSLQGMAGLLIGLQIENTSPVLQLRSLGDAPEVGVTLVRREPLRALCWGTCIVVVACGLAWLKKPAAWRAKYVVSLLVIATIVPVVLPWFVVGDVCDGLFFGAAIMGMVYLAIALLRSFALALEPYTLPGFDRVRRWMIATTAGVLIFSLTLAESAQAQAPPPDAAASWAAIEKLIPALLDEARPVKIPDDTVVVPFDVADPRGVENADRVLVPYATYLALWKLVHPEAKVAMPNARFPYGVAAARWETQLGSDDVLDLHGTLELEVFSDQPTVVPLPLEGGMLLSATLDGKPAQVKMVQADAAANPAAPVQQMAKPAAAPGGALLLLELRPAGRKKLELRYRLNLQRQGGWRVAHGTLLASSGAGLFITGPNQAAEIRVTGTLDREAFETTKAGEVVSTALDASGQFTLSWRPKLLENVVERGVSSTSQCVFDVRQDVLRATWRTTVEFPRSRRDRLTFQTPTGYVVERVAGENIRAWESKAVAGSPSSLEITLLKEVADKETVTVFLARYGAVGHGEMATLGVPMLSTTGAQLQQGTITLRRDPLLDVRITNTQGVQREDASPDATLLQAADSYDVGPLPLNVFQAYRFTSLPATVGLAIAPTEVKTEAEIHALLNVSERTTLLEAQIVITPRDLPINRVDIVLPAELSQEDVSATFPGGFEKSFVRKDDRTILTVLARNGQAAPFSLILSGKLPTRNAQGVVAAPRIEVLGVARQRGMLVIQADPAFEVAVEKLEGAEIAPVREAYDWLLEAKRSTAQSALRWPGGAYHANIRLRPKATVIHARLFHNVKVTPRTVEQTILVDYEVAEAGIRELSLLLPESLRGARVTARNTRRTVIDANDKSLPAGFVRLRIELEDEFLGHYQVLLASDALLSSQAQTIVMPSVEQGDNPRRFLSIESAGRDEVVVDQPLGLTPLARGQQAYNELTSVLGGDNFAQAFAATTDRGPASLQLSLKQRETVETASARIGLAETLLVLDRSGAYRARQTYRVDNSSEQFLEVQLPPDAKLWTTTVDTRSVKPVAGASSNSVRIPLIRRARGDADYEVALIYAGRRPRLGWWGSVEFPFPKAVNINVERSVVRLMLPETYRWFSFDGSLGQPVGEEGVQKTQQDYFRRQLGLSLEVLKSGDRFASARAENNMKQLGLAIQNNYSLNGSSYANDQDLAKSFTENTATLNEGLKQAEDQVAEVDGGLYDNRQRFNERFGEQTLQRAKNVTGNEQRNFDAGALQGQNTTAAKDTFSKQWLDSNKLSNSVTPQGKKSSSRYVDNFDDGEAKADKAEQPLSKAQNPHFSKESLSEAKPQASPQSQVDELGVQRQQALGRYRSKLAAETEQQQLAQNQQQQVKGQSAAGNSSATSNESLDFQLPAEFSANGPASGGMGGGGTEMGSPLDRKNEYQLNQLWSGVEVLPGAATRGEGLASLQIEIPQRGQTFRFVTARGDVSISVHYIDAAWLARVGVLLLTLVVMAVLVFAVRRLDIVELDRRLRWAAPLVLVALGLGLLLLSDLPRWGLLLLAIAIMLGIRAALLARTPVVAM